MESYLCHSGVSELSEQASARRATTMFRLRKCVKNEVRRSGHCSTWTWCPNPPFKLDDLGQRTRMCDLLMLLKLADVEKEIVPGRIVLMYILRAQKDASLSPLCEKMESFLNVD